jgi:hypothetical protein
MSYDYYIYQSTQSYGPLVFPIEIAHGVCVCQYNSLYLISLSCGEKKLVGTVDKNLFINYHTLTAIVYWMITT